LRPSRTIYFTIALLAMLTASAIYTALLSPEANDLSSSEEGPRGTLQLVRSLKEAGYPVEVLLTSPALLLEEADPENVVYLSCGRGKDLTPTEVQDLRKFYSEGGRMIIAEDGHHASSLSVYDNIDFLGGQLYDERFLGDPDFIQIDVNWREFSGTLVLNRPTGLASSGGETIARSGTSSWVDRNGNGKRDPDNSSFGEFPGSRIVAILTDPDFPEKGGGCIAYISDASLFTNEMLVHGDNLDFAVFLISYLLPEGGKVVIDDSTHKTEGLTGLAQGLLRGPVILTTDINFKIVVGTLSTVLLVAIVYLYVPPPKFRHVNYLNRSGLAQLIDNHVGLEHAVLMRKVVLDRVRIRNSMSVESFSQLSWERLREMIGDDDVYNFIRGDDSVEIKEMLRRIEEWKGR
jgi:hypothetical protein